MNRFKAEEARARQEARSGKTEAEIAALDREDALKARITELTREIHIERFPEEYDHYYDSIEDVKDRKRGINPMNKEYIAKVKTKREELGVELLAENGMPTPDETWEIAYSDAERRLRG